MGKKSVFVGQKVKTIISMKLNQIKLWASRYGFKAGLLLAVLFMLQQKDLNLQLNLSAAQQPEAVFTTLKETTVPTDENEPEKGLFSQMNIASSLTNAFKKPKTETTFEVVKETPKSDDNLSNTYSNMTYGKTSNLEKPDDIHLSKIKRQKAYINRFARVAQSEMRKYGIPASIKLAQGLIESNAGDSRLSKTSNNHFGMKCFSTNCQKDHCRNFTDDSHKDFFRVYKSAWESYRAHSKMLQSKRYRPLFKLSKKDYKAWARGLKKAGYATDKNYAEKLIRIIEELELYQFDNI